MNEDLKGKKVAILVANGYEQVELTEPLKALKNANAQVDIVSPEKGKVKAWDKDHWGESRDVNVDLDNANADDYGALVLPGGVINPDRLRTQDKATAFVRSFFEKGKPVAAICHGPWTMIDAGVVKGRKMTSYKSIKTDLENAGANWVDEEVVVDSGLVTSRNPGDLPAFINKMLEEFKEGRHEGQKRTPKTATV